MLFVLFLNLTKYNYFEYTFVLMRTLEVLLVL